MPRFPRFFGRKQAEDAAEPEAIERADLRADVQQGPVDTQAASASPPITDLVADAPPADALNLSSATSGGAVEPAAPDRPIAFAETAEPASPLDIDGATLSRSTFPADQVEQAAVAAAVAERRAPSGTVLIGGEEADLVPVIPDTVVEFQAQSTELDEESSASATVDALMGACRLMVNRVNAIRRLQDGTQIIAGLIALVSELDTQYATDWGVIRRNGLENVLAEVRQTIPEGDRFILESLDNGRGGLTAEIFLRDLRTIADADRPRMVSNYAVFLIFVIACVLRQYLGPLRNDPARLHEVSRRLDHLLDGVRDILLSRINGVA